MLQVPCPTPERQGWHGAPTGKWEGPCHVSIEGIALQSTPQGIHPPTSPGKVHTAHFIVPKPESMTRQGYGVKLSLASKPVLSQAPKHGAAPVFWSPRGLQSPDPWLKPLV